MRLASARRRRLVAFAAVLFAGAATYAGSFAYIRYAGLTDYARIRAGLLPEHASRRALHLTDGGSTLYDGFGYNVLRLNRRGPPGTPREVGSSIEFTCRAYFPLIHRALVDRTEITDVME